MLRFPIGKMIVGIALTVASATLAFADNKTSSPPPRPVAAPAAAIPRAVSSQTNGFGSSRPAAAGSFGGFAGRANNDSGRAIGGYTLPGGGGARPVGSFAPPSQGGGARAMGSFTPPAFGGAHSMSAFAPPSRTTMPGSVASFEPPAGMTGARRSAASPFVMGATSQTSRAGALGRPDMPAGSIAGGGFNPYRSEAVRASPLARGAEFTGPHQPQFRGAEIAGRSAALGNQAAFDRPGEFGPRPGGFDHRPVFSPAGRIAGGGLTGAAWAKHHEEFARNYGPGHDFGRDREFVHMHEHDFHDRDFRHFNGGERARWQAGLWHQDWHYGRWGWWYDVGDVWYPYAEPVYPYPQTVSEIVVPEATVIETPDGAVPYAEDAQNPGAETPQVPQIAAPASVSIVSAAGVELIVRPLPPAPVMSYQCAPLAGNYPEVRLCPISWIVVPE